jgi:hypothetical protein
MKMSSGVDRHREDDADSEEIMSMTRKLQTLGGNHNPSRRPLHGGRRE